LPDEEKPFGIADVWEFSQQLNGEHPAKPVSARSERAPARYWRSGVLVAFN
jgi:hypothetical protein